jgi:hypothetical protein
MKNLVLLFLVALSFTSCVSDDQGTQFFISTVENVEMASAYKVDSTSQIMIQYKRPTNCYLFDGFAVAKDSLMRDVAVRFAKLDEDNCDVDETVYEIPFNFHPISAGTYHFRFWKDRDVNGVDTFIEADAVVAE